MSELNVPSPRTPRLGLWIGFIPPFLVGLGLRSAGLGAQVLTGDELHSVHGALEMSVSEILRTWTFGGADYCIPLTAFNRFLMDQGVVFSEMTFRVPSMVAGLAAIVLLPWLAYPRIGQRAAILFAWLLALSPMLVVYSRIVRPYMPAAIAAGVAVLLFDHWLRRRHPAAATGYVISGAAAVYLHLGATPLVLAPLLYAAVRACLRPKHREGWMTLLWPALGIALAIATFLLPTQESLLQVLQVKRDGELPSFLTWLDLLRLQFGTTEWIIAAVALALVARGLAVSWQKERDFPIYLGTLVLAQAVGLMVLAPDRLEERAILNRYMLVALPLLLIPMAVGLGTSWRRGIADAANTGTGEESRAWDVLAISVAALVLLFATGPLRPMSPYWNSSFTNALTSVDFLGSGNWMPKQTTPRFYRRLARAKGEGAVIEYPWQNLSSHAFDAYQRTHGREVIVSSVIDRTGEARIALRNRAEPTAEGFLASRARYLVVHKNLLFESSRVVSGDIHHLYWLRAREKLWDPLRRAAKLMSAELEKSWGPPTSEDIALQVWDLDEIRARGPEGG